VIRRALALLPAVFAVAAAPAAAQSAGGAVYAPARAFAVVPRNAVAGTPLRFSFRASARVRVRVDFLAAGRVVTRAALGVVRRGARSVRWTPPAGALPAGSYTARLVLTPVGRSYAAATTPARATVAIVAPAPAPAPPAPAPAPSGVFPVQGPYTFGDPFGVDRPGHVHQGQDIVAAAGTPIVAPLAGAVLTTAYQASGAGYYVVLHGADARDYVFMHLLAGSTAVAKGQVVVAGQRLGLVGATGDATGPHLHFEIWPDGWYASQASLPIDPLPQLKAWAGLP
jgi:murein DD-endopeptidase MepM/ murein hydrolase activator NlpD